MCLTRWCGPLSCRVGAEQCCRPAWRRCRDIRRQGRESGPVRRLGRLRSSGPHGNSDTDTECHQPWPCANFCESSRPLLPRLRTVTWPVVRGHEAHAVRPSPGCGYPGTAAGSPRQPGGRVVRGNPVGIRDCPAAVSGNDRRHTHWAHARAWEATASRCLAGTTRSYARCARESEDLPLPVRHGACGDLGGSTEAGGSGHSACPSTVVSFAPRACLPRLAKES